MPKALSPLQSDQRSYISEWVSELQLWLVSGELLEDWADYSSEKKRGNDGKGCQKNAVVERRLRSRCQPCVEFYWTVVKGVHCDNLLTVIVHCNPINPVDNPIPVYGHLTRDNIYINNSIFLGINAIDLHRFLCACRLSSRSRTASLPYRCRPVTVLNLCFLIVYTLCKAGDGRQPARTSARRRGRSTVGSRYRATLLRTDEFSLESAVKQRQQYRNLRCL
jgi:hypothetical protein